MEKSTSTLMRIDNIAARLYWTLAFVIAMPFPGCYHQRVEVDELQTPLTGKDKRVVQKYDAVVHHRGLDTEEFWITVRPRGVQCDYEVAAADYERLRHGQSMTAALATIMIEQPRDSPDDPRTYQPSSMPPRCQDASAFLRANGLEMPPSDAEKLRIARENVSFFKN